MAPQLYIIVYKGDPVDLQSTRHTALFISENNQATGDLLDLGGAAGFFAFERVENTNPTQGRTFVKKIPVGPILKGPTKQQLTTKIAATPINNTTRSWNCHTWIGDALGRVVAENWISSQTKSSAISSMAGVIVEAADEE